MSRKLTLTFALATAATIAAASLASTTADARGFGGGFGGGRVASGGFGGGHMGGNFGGARMGNGGRTLTPILNPGRGNPGRIGNPRFPRWPGHPGHNWTYHPHGHLVFRGGRWITIDEVVDEAPVAPVSGPCTCLTKTYTADGLVVFADVCTKEAASARVDEDDSEDTAKPADKSSDATEDQPAVPAAPTSQNYAGRTYQDYLAANGKAGSEAKLKN
jgi:hypothetical protein